MSRIIVKNLPDTVTDEKLRKRFGTQGDVTDVQLKYTKDGRFRHFAFIGFKSDEDAANAQKHFNDTFVGSCRITTEVCTGPVDPNKPRPWSKYAPGSSAHDKNADTTEPKEKADGRKGKLKNAEEQQLYEKYKDDPQFAEYMQLHQKGKGNIWSNDILLEKSVEQDESSQSTPPELADKKQSTEVSDDTEVKLEEKKEDTKDKKPKKWKEFHTVKIQNLPPKTKKKDVKKFFQPLKAASIRVPRFTDKQSRGIAFVGFSNEKDMKTALKKHKSFISAKQVLVTEYINKNRPSAKEQEEHNQDCEATIADTGRLFLRNLSYTIQEKDLQELFGRFGPVADIFLPIDRHTRRLKGYAIVTYVMPEHALRAYTQLDGSIYQGRLLHIVAGKAKMSFEELLEEEGLSFKDKKQIKQKAEAKQPDRWNTLFLGTDAVAEAMADKYNVSKQDVFNSDGKISVGVRMALGETELVNNTKQFLEDNGIHIDAFNRPPTKRSKTVIIVKNLPHKTDPNVIDDMFRKYGEVARVILPPHGITAVVEFLDSTEASKAFTKLAFTKFGHTPLYLEWAPDDLFVQKEKKDEAKDNSNENQDEEEEDAEPDSTVFVKNLNFSTSEESLKKHFEKCGSMHSVTIAKKKNMKNANEMLSMGYGFVQFKKKAAAQEALKTLQNTLLEGHRLELKMSNRTVQNSESNRKIAKIEKQTGTKINVRNIPFQATKKEIQDLFKTFGELKAVRLPKKVSGSGDHRGFGFVEYLTKGDAKRAFESLASSTHLYGRRLVLEWAQADETVEELMQKTAANVNNSPPKKRRKVSEFMSAVTVEGSDDE